MWKHIHGFDISMHLGGTLKERDGGMKDDAAERCGLSEKVLWESWASEENCAPCMSEHISIFSGGLTLSYQTLTDSTSHCLVLFNFFLSIWCPCVAKSLSLLFFLYLLFYLTMPGNGSYIQTNSSSYTQAYLGNSRPPANAAKHSPWATLCRDLLACSRLLQTHKRFPCCWGRK